MPERLERSNHGCATTVVAADHHSHMGMKWQSWKEMVEVYAKVENFERTGNKGGWLRYRFTSRSSCADTLY